MHAEIPQHALDGMVLEIAVAARHGDLEAIALAANEVRGRDAHVFHDQGSGRLAVPAELLLRRSERQALGPLLDGEAGDAARPRTAGARHDQVEVAHATAG